MGSPYTQAFPRLTRFRVAHFLGQTCNPNPTFLLPDTQCSRILWCVKRPLPAYSRACSLKISSLKLLSSLRLTSRIAPSNPQLIRQSLVLPTRHFRHPLFRLEFRPRSPTIVSPLLICRSFSLGSLFSRSKPVSSPSPVAVAHIARLEADANATPHDLSKQLSLFESLVDTGLKPGYEVVVTRWERMCEFVCAYPFCRPASY